MSANKSPVKTPVKTLGILGGGQLGRMSAQAAAKLGIDVVIFTPEENSPASQVAKETIVAEYNDEKALQEFSGKVDVISYEFENIPVETVRYLQKFKPVYPDEKLLEVAQDRINEKSFMNALKIETARWIEPKNASEISTVISTWNKGAAILKTARFGYDGKGQRKIDSKNNIDQIWQSFNGQKLIMEEIIDFQCEISVIVARDSAGNMATYGPVLNEHKNHILDRSTWPAPITEDLKTRAINMTKRLAEAVNLRGVLALEMFVTKDGRILGNEIAPRTHNSGHWTIDACPCSQFEQHVRAVCGLPLGDAAPHSAATMINLIGDDINETAAYQKLSAAYVHDYGKIEARPGRKMGHVTILSRI